MYYLILAWWAGTSFIMMVCSEQPISRPEGNLEAAHKTGGRKPPAPSVVMAEYGDVILADGLMWDVIQTNWTGLLWAFEAPQWRSQSYSLMTLRTFLKWCSRTFRKARGDVCKQMNLTYKPVLHIWWNKKLITPWITTQEDGQQKLRNWFDEIFNNQKEHTNFLPLLVTIIIRDY